MTIVQVIPMFGLAGAEIMCENLIYELINLGHSVTVISMYYYKSAITDRLESKGVDIRYLGKKKGLDLSMIRKIKKVLNEVKPNVVHTHLYSAEYAIPASMQVGVNCVVHTVHNIAEKENRSMARKLNKFFFKHCHVVPVALSELIRDSIVREYKLTKDKIPVIFNGIDLSKCIQKTDYSVNGNFKILHIGRFSEQKNHIGLIKAFKLFHDKHADSELWLIGDGEKKTEIEKYVADNELISSVKFLGLQSNVYGYLHDADIFTLPSNYEGIPMTLIEAMGTGLPIVVTAVGGVPDMLDKESSVFVTLDEKVISDAFERYYVSESLRKSHGNNARYKSQQFSSLTMAEKYSILYKKINNGK